MGFPIITLLIFIFILWLQYESRKHSRQSKKQNVQFWNREKNADLARRKDIQELDYLTISTDFLPMEDHEDDTANSYRDILRGLSGKKAINLSAFTNTELKYRYGAVNLKLLSEYDNNYTILVSILQKWAERLYQDGDLPKAQIILEYSIVCHSDVTKSYRLLADIYLRLNQPEKLHNLITTISKTKLSGQDKLIAELTSRLYLQSSVM